MPHYLPKMIPRRWPSYASATTSAFCLGFITLNAPPYGAINLSTFGILAIFTALYIGILLCYGRSETQYKHTLTRCYTHIASFVLIAVLWLALGIFFAVHAEVECHRHTPVCVHLRLSAILAFFIFLSSGLCVAVVMCPIAVTGVGYNTHVEDARERARNRALTRQQSETEDATIYQNNVDGVALPNLPSPPLAHIY